MKKLLLILVLCLTINTAYSATDRSIALQNMDKSYQNARSTCLKIARNFHYDPTFSGYIKNKCALYEADRQRMVTLLYPATTKNGNDYRYNREIYMSNYMIQMDNNQLSAYSSIINEYCKYNSYKFEKKDPQACQNLDNLFK